MKYDNVDYRHEPRNMGPEIGGSSLRSSSQTSAGAAGKIITLVFSIIGITFTIIGVILVMATHYPLPGMIFVPLGIVFSAIGISVGKAMQHSPSGTARGAGAGTSTPEAYVYASNPAYGASEHDELRARVGAQQRRIDALERRCDALESEINRMR